jgi:uncharacterized protein YjeT (DUF2065 family)
MDTSVLIARLLGPVLLVIGLAVLIQPERIRHLVREFLQGEALLFLSGLLTLVSGLAIVNAHAGWDPGLPLVVTLFGWLMVLAGIARLLIPGVLKSIGAGMSEGASWLRIPGAVLLALGAYLAYCGYVALPPPPAA